MAKLRWFSAVLSLVCATHVLIAQDASSNDTTTPTNPELLQLQTQQAIMDAKLAILTDQQKMTIGVLPGSDIKPKQGSVTADGDHPIQSLAIAYTAAGLIAQDIAATVCKAIPVQTVAGTTAPKTVVIYDQTEIASLVNYQAFVNQLVFIQRQFDDKLKPELTKTLDNADKETTNTSSPKPIVSKEVIAPALIPGLVEGGIKSIIDIMGLFRTDTTIHAKDFTPDDTALIASTAAQLKSQGCTVYEPAVEPVSVFDTQSSLVTKLSSLREDTTGMQLRLAVVKNKLQQQSDSLNAILQAKSALDALNTNITQETDPKKKKVLQDQLPAAQLAVANAVGAFNTLMAPAAGITADQALNLKVLKDKALKSLDPVSTTLSTVTTALDGLQSSLFKVDDSGVGVMSKLLRAERLYNIMTAANGKEPRVAAAYILVEKMAVLGGGVITKENLFFWSTHLYYSGGSIATFTLFSPTGSVVSSGTITKRSNNVRSVKEDGEPGNAPEFYTTSN